MDTRHFRAILLTALILAFGAGTRATAATLFESMGGEGALHTVVDRFADLLVADPRTNFTFADADMTKFKKLLYEQLCELSGGPCRYTGRDMRTSHAKLKLRTSEFNALAEDLYIALGKAGVAYRQQNRLMALLAPMQRDIVASKHTQTLGAQPATQSPPSAPSPPP